MKYNVITRVKQKIKNLLQDKGMSIYELAKQAQISDACIRNWYSKRNYAPSLESLEKICKVLNISMAQLFMKDSEQYYPINGDTLEMINKFNKLTHAQKNAIAIHIDSYLKK